MAVVINTNYAATVASNNLAASNSMLQKSLNRLSSGSKIVNPSDDAGGLAVSMKLSAAAVRQGAVATNIGNVSVNDAGTTTLAIAARDLTDSTSGVGTITAAADLGVLSQAAVSTAIENVATFRATNGSEQSRLNFAAELVTVNKANLESANSRIVDVDVASESTQLARWNVLVQAGTSMLAQANQSSQTALKLLQ